MASGGAGSLGKFFGRNGPLQQAHPEFEYRAGQIEMATAVAAALAERHHLLIEAGTGTGKTLAYLLPAVQSGRRVMISTGTRNLQEQLVTKDVPLLSRALGREVNVVSVKGRQNYACKQKIAELQAQPVLPEGEEFDLFGRLRAWAAGSATGDQAEMDFLPEGHPLWQRMNARREACTGQKCPLFEQCFVTLVHQRAAEAELVVVNHHLFFADLALKSQELPGVLPAYEAVVFDEAHELVEAAGQFFGTSFSSHQAEELARDTGRELKQRGLDSSDLQARIEHVRGATQRFFSYFGEGDGRMPFQDRAQFVQDNSEVYDQFVGALGYLGSGLEAIADKPEEIHMLIRRLEEARRAMVYLLESEEEGYVYWMERRGNSVTLQAAPIEVGELLRERLFTGTDTVVMTSATLAVGGGFDYVRGRLGVEHAREQVVASPFAYSRQALLYLPEGMPEPGTPEFRRRAIEEIAELLQAASGRAFVLCTSKAQMRMYHEAIEGRRLGYPLLLQDTGPRNRMLERFRTTPGAVLFATSSFWQGVDVQGEQLSCVIVDRLPFAAPQEPVVAARIRLMEEQGRNAFKEFQIPEAVLALKQGFGRLIRSASDRGVVALLDPRISTKSYGKHFLASLPDFAVTRRLEEVRQFFAEPSLAARS